MKKAKKQRRLVWRILRVILLILLVLAVILGAMYGISQYQGKKRMDNYTFTAETFSAGPQNRIHFLNTGGGDCILIETNGMFALIDAAEDSNYPADKPNLNYDGYEDKIIEYLKKVAGDANGNVVLQWVLGTHSHSDHIGCFDEIILHEDITVFKAYLKEYDETYIRNYEIKRWDNLEVYQEMVDACNKEGVELISDLPDDAWQFGDFTVQFFNTGYNTEKVVGDNENAVGTKLSINGRTVFLAADMNNITGVEKAIKDDVGKVDILKVGHHGYTQSSSYGFIKTLDPDVCIVTNKSRSRIYPDVYWKLTMTAGASTYVTGDQDGIIVTFTDDGQMKFTDKIH